MKGKLLKKLSFEIKKVIIYVYTEEVTHYKAMTLSLSDSVIQQLHNNY